MLWKFGKTPGGAYPEAGLIADKKGDLYGTTWQGEDVGLGTVFKLSLGKRVRFPAPAFPSLGAPNQIIACIIAQLFARRSCEEDMR
ncbi:MAG: hypothetical protein ACREP6_04140 [Candidatus Binataceae bacterium]